MTMEGINTTKCKERPPSFTYVLINRPVSRESMTPLNTKALSFRHSGDITVIERNRFSQTEDIETQIISVLDVFRCSSFVSVNLSIMVACWASPAVD